MTSLKSIDINAVRDQILGGATEVGNILRDPPDTPEELVAALQKLGVLVGSVFNVFHGMDRTDYEAIRARGHAINQQKVAPLPSAPPPPPPTALQFGEVLTFDPRKDPRFKSTYKVWQSKADRLKFIVTDGRIGSGEPNALFPVIIVNGQEVGGGWEPVDN